MTDEAEADLDSAIIAVNAFTQHVKTLTRMQNPISFTTNFTDAQAATFKWCHAFDMCLDTKLLEDDELAFRRMFPSLPTRVQTLCTQKITASAVANAAKRKATKHAGEGLKRWVAKECQPTQSTMDFPKRLKRIQV